ncbi:MAG: DUF4097 family beta strand repeat protein [Gemmatimonadetes bacterium]|nr:DUF4097 family beta strand repeat protein [Gemmatimonadota bacterium]
MKRSERAVAGIAALLLAGALAGFAGAAGGGYGEGYVFETREGVLAGQVRIVEAETRNGFIHIRSGDEDSVAVEVIERVRKHTHEDAEKIADKVDLTIEAKGEVLVIKMDRSKLSGKEKSAYSASFTITLPSSMSVRVESSNGDIEVAKVEGSVHASTSNGNVRMKGSGGDADLRTTNGDIYADLAAGDVSMRTTNGSIRLAGVRGDVKGHTTNGSIQLVVDEESDFLVEASTTNGTIVPAIDTKRFVWEANRNRTHLEGEYGSGRHKVSLKTTNGSVRIEEI